MRDDENERAEDYTGPLDLPDEHEVPEEEDEAGQHFSLTDDVLALLEDGKTYAEAELRYQKSRAGFVGNRIKGAIAIGLGAFGVLHLALIAATIGAVLVLAPIIGAFPATLLVTFALVAVGVLLLRMLKNRLDEISRAFDEGDGND